MYKRGVNSENTKWFGIYHSIWFSTCKIMHAYIIDCTLYTVV